jgi:hypothetical protein
MPQSRSALLHRNTDSYDFEKSMAIQRYNPHAVSNMLRRGYIGWLDASIEGPHANRVQVSEFSLVPG